MTVFSAPDYPQFQASEERYLNRAAVLRFQEPDFATPTPIVYSALLPRPSVCNSPPPLLHLGPSLHGSLLDLGTSKAYR